MKGMSRAQIKALKARYPAGTRVCLDNMGEDPHPIPACTKGAVIAVDDMGTLHCKFDNGRSLGICPEVDSFHKISEQTKSQDIEPEMSM